MIRKIKVFMTKNDDFESIEVNNLQYGDIVENGWAGELNPKRFGVYLTRGKDTIMLSSCFYEPWHLIHNGKAKIKIRGNVYNDNMLDDEKAIADYLMGRL